MKIFCIGAFDGFFYFAQNFPVSAIPENLKKNAMLLSEKILQRFKLIKLMI
jgi:hypothetical protein